MPMNSTSSIFTRTNNQRASFWYKLPNMSVRICGSWLPNPSTWIKAGGGIHTTCNYIPFCRNPSLTPSCDSSNSFGPTICKIVSCSSTIFPRNTKNIYNIASTICNCNLVIAITVSCTTITNNLTGCKTVSGLKTRTITGYKYIKATRWYNACQVLN